MKSHTGLRLILTWMTLNDLEHGNSPYFAFSPNSIALLANYVTVVEDRLVMSVLRKISSPSLQSSTFGHN